ncbi:unnamed protein product [Enterobius vermicularis]|uniref:Tudor domain-containing protein n=1 Tax=Enterobius vermicularis TaxID=51028 RepID=A0A0N4UT77_ENTVE|nr:unnamed protein product [Enterobius vermicularis]
MSDAEELANYKLQLEQVDAALLAEPDNEELKKLKNDLKEIIALQEELTKTQQSADIPETPSTTTTSSKTEKDYSWKVGDRCMALSTNGQKFLAVIDGFSQDAVAVTFIGKGSKHMMKPSELSPVTDGGKPVWEKAKPLHHRKSEWQIEKERRRNRALKKEHRRRELEEAKEEEKNKWLSFNAKASSRSMKGFKRPTASGSAPDGPAWGIQSQTSISSRRDLGAFKSTQRGNMDSLF